MRADLSGYWQTIEGREKSCGRSMTEQVWNTPPTVCEGGGGGSVKLVAEEEIGNEGVR